MDEQAKAGTLNITAANKLLFILRLSLNSIHEAPRNPPKWTQGIFQTGFDI
jgi:hypothetical protein